MSSVGLLRKLTLDECENNHRVAPTAKGELPPSKHGNVSDVSPKDAHDVRVTQLCSCDGMLIEPAPDGGPSRGRTRPWSSFTFCESGRALRFSAPSALNRAPPPVNLKFTTVCAASLA
jgi:hypothetical protein